MVTKTQRSVAWITNLISLVILILFISLQMGANQGWAQSLYDTGPPYTHRYVSSIAFSPNYQNDHTIFATVMNAGVYKSQDGGNSWSSVNSGINEKYPRKIVLSPNYETDKTAFVLSAELEDNSTNTIFKTTDGGASWKPVFSTTGLWTFAISPNFSADHTLIAGAHYGDIYKSTQKGESGTWVRVPAKIFRPETFAFSPNFQTDQTIFAGNFSALAEIFKSVDAGLTWTKVNSEDVYSFNVLATSPLYATDHTVFAGTGRGGMRKSTDGGLTWSPANTGLDFWFSGIGSIAISANFAHDRTVFIATGNGVYKSTDAGLTWTPVNNALTDLNTEAVAISPNYANDQTLLVGTHAGIFKSIDAGMAWVPVNNGIPLSSFTNVSNDPEVISTLPSVAVDPQGYVHIAYWGTYFSPDSPDGVTTDVFYTTNRSGSFVKPQKIEVPAGHGWYSKDLHLTVDKDGFAHVAFRRAEDQIWLNADDDIFYATNRTGTWVSELVAEGMTGGFVGPNDPFVGMDSLGTVHLIFEAFGYYHSSKPLSSEFQTPRKFADDGYGVRRHSMVVQPNGAVHFVYRGDSNDSWGDLFYRRGHGGIFSERVAVPSFTGVEDHPSVTIDHNGKVHIAFLSRSHGDIYYTSNAVGDSFAVPGFVGAASYPAARPVIRIGPDGSINIADEAGKYFRRTVNGFEQISVTQVDMPIMGGKSFFDMADDGITHLVYHTSANRISGDLNHEIYYLRFLMTGNLSHLARGPVINSDGSAPANEDITFLAFIVQRPQEVLTEKSFACGFKNGEWFVECGSFPTPWQVGDALQVDFTNTKNGEVGLVEGVLTSAQVDYFPQVALPVELIAFSAFVDGQIIRLRWTTAIETNNIGFEIQRSQDKINFAKIGFVAGNETIAVPHSYSYTDHNLPVGTYYYRLKQIDANGSFEYSGIVEVGIGVPKTFELGQNYPNPFNPETTIKYQLPEDSQVTLEIYNTLGQRIRTLVDQRQPAGYYSAYWDGKDDNGRPVASGVYLYGLWTKEFVKTRKMAIVR